ncbi:MAG: hypothetical protein WCA78_08960 [Rhizomicrobium sp.]
MTAKRLKRPRDPVQLGKLVGDILTGQVEDSQASVLSDDSDFTRKGGLKGGAARAAKLAPQRRTEIAKKAAKARWGNNKKKSIK